VCSKCQVPLRTCTAFMGKVCSSKMSSTSEDMHCIYGKGVQQQNVKYLWGHALHLWEGCAAAKCQVPLKTCTAFMGRVCSSKMSSTSEDMHCIYGKGVQQPKQVTEMHADWDLQCFSDESRVLSIHTAVPASSVRWWFISSYLDM
jgi:triosephosphate isomerase